MKIASVVFCIAISLASAADACSCESVRDRWSPLEKLWLKVRRVFNEQARTDTDYKRYCTDYGMEVTFAVQQAWKGVASRRVVLLTGRGGGDCGVEFKPGTDYIVYAYPPAGDGCQTNICTRTREVADGADDLEFLRQHPALRIR